MENKKLFNISRILVDSLIVIFVLASTLMMAFKGQGTLASKGVEMFKYYTVDSNILMGIVALIKIYFDIEITLGKIQKVPLWTHLLYFVGVVALSVTFLTVVFFLAPMEIVHGGSYFDSFKYANTFMHLLTPILSVLGFLLFERNRKMNICWSLLPVSSVFIYAIYYLIQLFIHDSFGKSEYDWYGFTTSPIPWPVFLLVMIGASYLVSLGLFYASGSHMRKEKTKV